MTVIVAEILAMMWLYTAVSAQDCPPKSKLEPYCFCKEGYYGAGLYCRDIFNPRDLVMPVEACRNRNVTALGVSDSALQYIQHDLFKNTNFQKIAFMNTQLMALSNAPLAFEGLEDSLVEIRAVATEYTTLWRFRQLKELKELRLIDINRILMESLSERLPPLPKLETFGLALVKAGIDFLDDEILADCHALKILDLRGNHISHVKRSMLPDPANKLTIINFQDNKVEVIPNDFFLAMPKIMDVNFGNNLIRTLDQRTYFWLYTHVQTLDLSGNPLRCDCRMAWITHVTYPHWLHAECTEPESMKGKKLKHLTHHDLYCAVQ